MEIPLRKTWPRMEETFHSAEAIMAWMSCLMLQNLCGLIWNITWLRNHIITPYLRSVQVVNAYREGHAPRTSLWICFFYLKIFWSNFNDIYVTASHYVHWSFKRNDSSYNKRLYSTKDIKSITHKTYARSIFRCFECKKNFEKYLCLLDRASSW